MKSLPPYYMLSDEELIDRIKGLEGKIVKTLDRGNKNLIKKVLESSIKVKSLESNKIRYVSISNILKAYRELFRKGSIKKFEKFFSIEIAILKNAVDEQIESFKAKRRLGLRIKTFKWFFEALSDDERYEFLWELLMASEKAIKSKRKELKPIQELIESWQETADIISDKELMIELEQAEKEYKSGDTVSWEKVRKELNL